MRALPVVVGLLFLSSAASAAAEAAASPAAESSWSSRTLRGHRFLTPSLSPLEPTAFITAHIGFRQGVSFDRTGSVPVEGRDVTVTVANLVQTFDLAAAISDRVSIEARLGGQANLGIDAPSLYARGLGVLLAAEMGAAYRIVRSERHGYQVALRVDGGVTSGKLTPLVRLRTVLVEAPEASLDALVGGVLLNRVEVPVTRYRGGVSLQGAWAFAPWLSLQAALLTRLEGRRVGLTDVRTGATVETSETWATLAAGVALTADFDPLGVPVALMAEYAAATDAPPSVDSTLAGRGVAHALGAGLYYSAEKHLQLGVSAATTLSLRPVVLADDTTGQELRTRDPTDVRARLLLRYMF